VLTDSPALEIVGPIVLFFGLMVTMTLTGGLTADARRSRLIVAAGWRINAYVLVGSSLVAGVIYADPSWAWMWVLAAVVAAGALRCPPGRAPKRVDLAAHVGPPADAWAGRRAGLFAGCLAVQVLAAYLSSR
jgi:hypothetical protein